MKLSSPINRLMRRKSHDPLLCLLIILFGFNDARGWLLQRQGTNPSALTFSLHASTSGLMDFLGHHGYDRRMRTINRKDLPICVEIQEKGKCKMALITDIHCGPRIQVQYHESQESSVLDIGQVTTVWNQPNISIEQSKRLKCPPASYVERQLDALYMSHVGRARSGKQLTKKQITKSNLDEHSQAIVRRTIKAGTNQARIVDSQKLCDLLFRHPNAQNRFLCASMLAEDAQLGGRFKRWPCILLNQDVNNHNIPQSISIINGGWLVVDQSMRADTEARKFAERGEMTTKADERIVRRLECLAMGELLSGEDSDELELDARSYLRALDLGLDPIGARKALVRIGRWTEGEKASNSVQFWPRPVIEAAKDYVRQKKDEEANNVMDKGRVDLRRLPCLSIDAKRVAFRDDAFGIRKRSSTGRRVSEEASKWEILIHIADVSDILAKQPKETQNGDCVTVLRQAAESRGASRYDLPSGPLHLLPPTVLQQLSLSSKKKFNRCVTMWLYIDERDGKLLDAGIERSIVRPPIEFSFNQASNLMGTIELENERQQKLKTILVIIERIIAAWATRRRMNSQAAQKREQRLAAKEAHMSLLSDVRDDGKDGFIRTRGHLLVDNLLDLYAFAASGLLRRANAPVPRAKGADAARGGRVATSPLRRFIDGQAQGQLLAALCNHGELMTVAECRNASKTSNERRNAIANDRAARKKVRTQ